MTIADLRKVEQQQWPLTYVESVMTPASHLPTVAATDDLAVALERFGDAQPLLAVVDERGTLVGLLYRDAVEGYVRMREVLGLRR